MDKWNFCPLSLCHDFYSLQAAALKKEKETQKKALKKEKKTLRTVMKVKGPYLACLSARFFKKASGILQSPPSICCLSVRRSHYLLLNHWMKSNQIWCVSCSHGRGVQRHILFGPAPWGNWEGPKGQISLNIIKFQLQSQFQIF